MDGGKSSLKFVTLTCRVREERHYSFVSKKKEKWDPIRFLSQSSKFVSFPKPPLPGMNRPIQVSPGEVVWSSSNTGTSIGKLRKFQFAPLDDVVMGGVSSSTFQNGK